MRKSKKLLMLLTVTITFAAPPSLLLLGCGSPQRLGLNTSGTVNLRAGGQFQFSALLNGVTPTNGITWAVIPASSNSQYPGEITQTGLYSAPIQLASPLAAQVVATLGSSGVIKATAAVKVLPLPPEITSLYPTLILSDNTNVDISGTNFLPQTIAFVNGLAAQFQYQTQSTASIVLSLEPGATQASITIKNPWDSKTSSAHVIPADVPEESVPTQGSEQPVSMNTELGCTNPNTGAPTNDWGTGSDPLYVQPNSMRIGNPRYTTNTIFWTSIENGPGQSVLLTGAFTNSPKTVRIAMIPPDTDNWESLVQSSSTVVPAQQQGSSALYFTIPQTLSPGVYGFEIDDPSAPPIMGLANVPSIDWIIGVPTATGAGSALQHPIHDCGAEPGETLRIFGKNLGFSTQVLLISPNGESERLAPVAGNTNSMSVVIPADTSPGPYRIVIGSAGNSELGATEAIYVFPAPQYLISQTACGLLIGDGVTDNTRILQSCLDNNAPVPGSNDRTYIDIPPGIFLITGTIRPHSGEVLVGSGPGTTKIECQPGASAPSTWFAVPPFFGISGISVSGPVDPYMLSATDSSGNPVLSGHLYLNDVRLTATTDLSDGHEDLVSVGGPDVQIYGSTFVNNSFLGVLLLFGDGAILSGNTFTMNNGWMEVEDSQNVIFENNTVDSTESIGSPDLSGGLSVSRGTRQFGPSAMSQNVYLGYNVFQNLGGPDKQVVLNDGGGGAYYGKLASSSADSVTLADPPAWNWMGTTNPETSLIAIVSGTGVGEYSLIKSYSGRTVNLLWPWKVIPDSTSVVVITQYDRNMTYAHNIMSNTMGVSIMLSNSIGGLIEDNVFNNSGTGILVWGFGPYGGPAAYSPVLDTSVLRNKINAGRGDWIQYKDGNYDGGIGIGDLPGILVSGVLIRGNDVTKRCQIFITNGWNQLTGILVEQNRANLSLGRDGAIQGISERDNITQQ